MRITSVNNALIKETAKLLNGKYRDESGLFLIEGEKGVEEATKAGVKIERIFVADSKFDKILKQVQNDIIVEVTEAIMAKITDTKNPPKIAAVAKQLKPAWSENFKKVILLENIKDPGNLGTIIRTASAFGIDALVLYGNTVDIYNPKCVRSAVGNLWKIPIFKFNSLEMFSNFERTATLPNSDYCTPLSEYKPAEKVLVMFGSEADGLSDKLKNFANVNLTIEMMPEVESLNLSASAAIIMYKISR